MERKEYIVDMEAVGIFTGILQKKIFFEVLENVLIKTTFDVISKEAGNKIKD